MHLIKSNLNRQIAKDMRSAGYASFDHLKTKSNLHNQKGKAIEKIIYTHLLKTFLAQSRKEKGMESAHHVKVLQHCMYRCSFFTNVTEVKSRLMTSGS